MGMNRIIKTAMLAKKVKSGELAELLGKDKQAFYNWLSRDTMGDKIIEVADALGCDIVLRDRETGKIYG